MLYLGLCFGIVASNIASHTAHLDAFRSYIATLVLIIPALAGARLLYVAKYWSHYKRNPSRIWDQSDGGCIMYGGLPLALLLSVPLLRVLRLNFASFWDVSSFTILVGMIFARVGCLMNGCCAGRPTKGWLGMYLPIGTSGWERRFPTQLLEAGCAAVLLLLAMMSWSRLPFRGALFLMTALGYGAARFVMDFSRERQANAKEITKEITLAQAISGMVAVVSISALTAWWQN